MAMDRAVFDRAPERAEKERLEVPSGIRKTNRGYENFKLCRPGGMRIILLRTRNGSPAVNPEPAERTTL
jgi:hypothetical protein